MDRAIANPHHPNLSIGNAGTQLIARPQLIGRDLVRSCFDINRCKFANILGRELGPDICFVNGVPTPGELFFGVAALYVISRRLASVHGCYPRLLAWLLY